MSISRVVYFFGEDAIGNFCLVIAPMENKKPPSLWTEVFRSLNRIESIFLEAKQKQLLHVRNDRGASHHKKVYF